jgi:hypothetical protein
MSDRILSKLAASLLMLTVVAVGCAKASGGTGGVGHPTGSNDLVLRVETAGGFVAPAYALTQIPEFSLYGDGRLVRPGPMMEIYPGPALPNLLVTSVSEDGIQAILRAAGAAGLLGADRRYSMPVVSDAPTTTFTVVTGGVRHVVSAYALGVTAGPGGQMSDEESRARAALVSFQAKLSSLGSWLPAGSVGPEQPFVPTGLRVFASPGAPAEQPGLREPILHWPLSTSLAALGAPVPISPDLRCGAVTGPDLAALLPFVRRANQLTPWRSGASIYTLTFRPLLPDESGCPR